jgi:GTP-binding protein
MMGGDPTDTDEPEVDDVDFEADELEARAESDDQVEMIGRVAVVGYPNVGKSTLVNRLSGTRQAIVHEQAGVTRDRKEIECEWNGARFLLIDTGGVDEGDPAPMAKQIITQAKLAIADADLVLLVVDGSAGMSAADQELADIVRSMRADVIVIANKLDSARREDEAVEFFGLGLGAPLAVSAHHGNNTGDLLDTVVERLREKGNVFHRAAKSSTITIAILGRPNVGKSTLVNALTGSDRVIVSEVAGTTRDSVDTNLEFEGHQIVLVDTAGIRRKQSGSDNLAYYSEVRSLQAADRANVAIVLVDASDGLREADIGIADKAREHHCATLVVLSKWDIGVVDLGDVQHTLGTKLRQRPEIMTASSLTGRNVSKILQKVVELHGRYSQRVPTAELNTAIGELKAETPPPFDRKKKRRLNILYATQYQTAPPRIRIHVNDRTLVTRNYAYFLENRLRERFGFEGCPLIIDFQSRAR